MRNLSEGYYNPAFSHIYVEKALWGNKRAERILSAFPEATVIEIGHYKDVFCRSGQDYVRQHRSQKLILAEKKGTLFYRGAPVCQDFGNEHFYYASCMMNCIYDCEYCYLKGMYPSGNMVIFVNLEDYFAEAEEILSNHPVYLCVSYDTDLMAMETVAGYVREWMMFAGWHENLTVEIRTKCANRNFFERENPTRGVIFAFTLSPQALIDAGEHGAPSLESRISCAALAIERGFTVRLCFDPALYWPDWESRYDEMLSRVFAEIDMGRVWDVSVGTFRISKDYLKKMRRNEPFSPFAQFPYQNEGGVYRYGRELEEKLKGFFAQRLKEKMPEEKIFM